jgi:hypothetical protein
MKYSIPGYFGHTKTGHCITVSLVTQETLLVAKEVTPHAVITVCNTRLYLLQKWVLPLRDEQIRQQRIGRRRSRQR